MKVEKGTKNFACVENFYYFDKCLTCIGNKDENFD
jgi:hypothetical protein